jgi:hypothetical protein
MKIGVGPIQGLGSSYLPQKLRRLDLIVCGDAHKQESCSLCWPRLGSIELCLSPVGDYSFINFQKLVH